jgi:hypothetical protein
MTGQIILTLVPALATAMSIWQFVDELLKKNQFCLVRAIVWAVLAVLLVLYVILNIYLMVANKKSWLFKKESRGYYNFFSQWYSEEGYITIYCNDLATWVDDDQSKPGKKKIYDSLLKKSQRSQLTVFIENTDKTSEKLENAGAKITEILKDKTLHFSCSVRRSNDIYSIIIRNKQKDKGDIICVEKMDPFPGEAFAEYLLSAVNTGKGRR